MLERLGDVRERAVALFAIATTLIAAGGWEQGRTQEILEALGEAFRIARKLDLPDGMKQVGTKLAEVLASAGRRDEALAVLDAAEVGFRKLGQDKGSERIAWLRQALSRRL
jgi:hypothetical protein